MWLHSSVGTLVEHRTGLRGGHGSESRWSPDFFQASSFRLLKLKIYCDDHSSLYLYWTALIFISIYFEWRDTENQQFLGCTITQLKVCIINSRSYNVIQNSKYFAQIYRAQHGAAMLVFFPGVLPRDTNTAAVKWCKHLELTLAI